MAQKKETKRGKKGQGTLVRGTSGVWMLRQVINGKVITKSLQTHNKREAEQKRKQLVKENLAQNKGGEDIDALIAYHRKMLDFYLAKKCAMKIELDKIFDSFKSNPTVTITEGTFNVYHSAINSLVSFVKANYPKVEGLMEITEEMVKEWLQAESTKGKSTNTVFLKTKCIKRVFKVLLGKHNQLSDMTFGSKGKVRYERQIFTEEQIKMILKTASGHSPDMKLLFYLGYFTGARRSDCCEMRWSNVDLEKKTITYLPKKTQKTGKLVVIPICDELMEVLESIKPAEINPDDYLSAKNAKDCDQRHMTDKINRVLKKAGVKKAGDNRSVSFHCLRHTFCSINANNGTNQLLLQAMLGHTSLDMTSKYYHPDVEAIRDKMESSLSLNDDDE